MVAAKDAVLASLANPHLMVVLGTPTPPVAPVAEVGVPAAEKQRLELATPLALPTNEIRAVYLARALAALSSKASAADELVFGDPSYHFFLQFSGSLSAGRLPSVIRLATSRAQEETHLRHRDLSYSVVVLLVARAPLLAMPQDRQPPHFAVPPDVLLECALKYGILEEFLAKGALDAPEVECFPRDVGTRYDRGNAVVVERVAASHLHAGRRSESLHPANVAIVVSIGRVCPVASLHQAGQARLLAQHAAARVPAWARLRARSALFVRARQHWWHPQWIGTLLGAASHQTRRHRRTAKTASVLSLRHLRPG
mmetsp:Transcript_76632/g.212959  ORF Transcript_76632/g.212959 Transcript_76632/m.212959 type:complete len:312 (+) Transcript_76632:495-1430(+)